MGNLSDDQIISKLKSILDFLGLNSPGTDILRWMGWQIIKGLATVDNTLSAGVTMAYKLMAFYDSSAFKSFINPYMGFFFTMAGLAIAYLGWTIIIRHRTDYNRLIVNALVVITFFAAMPWGMQQMYKMVDAGQKDLSSAKSLSSQMGDGTQVIKSNITDLYLLDKAKFKASKMSSKNYITSDSDVSVMDINEAVDTGSDSPLSDDGKQIFAKKLSNSSGKLKLADMQTHWFTADEAYYRYSWHPFLMIISLLMTMVVVLSTMFKVAQLSMELALVKAIAIGSSFTDIESGQRTKKLILKIRNIFIVLYLMALTLKIYFVFLDYIGSVGGINDLVRVIFTVAAGFLVIDGPNIIEELFGVNAGMGSAIKGAMGLMGAGFLASRAAGGMASAGKKALDVGKKMAGHAATAGGAALGAGKGALDGFKDKAASGDAGNFSTAADKLGGALGKSTGQDSPGGLSGMKAPLSNEAAAQETKDKIAKAVQGSGLGVPGGGAGQALDASQGSGQSSAGPSTGAGPSVQPSDESMGASGASTASPAAATGGSSSDGLSAPASAAKGAFAGFGHSSFS
ncbi:MAG: pLS20_p028 family conjugation system transmembrane protein, partial [Sporolactobacillus sp.]